MSNKINSITRLFIQDIHDRTLSSKERGQLHVRLPVTHVEALLELVVELELAASQATRRKPGEAAPE